MASERFSVLRYRCDAVDLACAAFGCGILSGLLLGLTGHLLGVLP